MDADLKAQVKSLFDQRLRIIIGKELPTVTAQAALELKSSMQASWASLRTLRTWLIAEGGNILPSEESMRLHSDTLLSDLEYETGTHQVPGTRQEFTWSRLSNVEDSLKTFVRGRFAAIWCGGQGSQRIGCRLCSPVIKAARQPSCSCSA